MLSGRELYRHYVQQQLAPGITAIYGSLPDESRLELFLPTAGNGDSALSPRLRYGRRFEINGYHLGPHVGAAGRIDRRIPPVRRLTWQPAIAWGTKQLAMKLGELAENLQRRERLRCSRGCRYHQTAQLLGSLDG